ncbi:MAG: TonB-dependent receptor [Bacteroidetes bacterium]|nr:TonB-dependent receptor [Bacteroidota bacterium]
MNKKSIRNICSVFLVVPLLNVFGLHAQEKNDSVNVAFGSVAKRDVLGAVSSINVPELMKKEYVTYSLDGLQSFVGGYTGSIWGQDALILVDGVPRSAWDVLSSEVASVTVLKDASAVVLYGSKAAKGVVLITTKRGQISPLTIHVRANTGIYVPKRYPKYLNSADYMTLYNEAAVNDGQTAYYPQDLIDKTKSGSDPSHYPDINMFSSDYLRKAYNRYDMNADVSGGNSFARYYSDFGMAYNNSLLKYGEKAKDNNYRFNMRANLDMDITNWLSANTNVSVIISDAFTGNGDFWGQSSSLRPNWFGATTVANSFSPLIPISELDQNNADLLTLANNSNNLIDGKYIFGGTSSQLTNVFADMLAGGYTKSHNRTFMFDVSMKADLSFLLKGLTFKAGYSSNFTNNYTEVYGVSYSVYQPTWSADNTTITGLSKYNTDQPSTNEDMGVAAFTQTMQLTSQFNYNKTFNNDHQVSAALIGWEYQTQSSTGNLANDQATYPSSTLSTLHRTTNLNLGFQANYNYKHRYYADFSAAAVHSPMLPAKNRSAFSPTFSLGWRISDEAFFKESIPFVDDLKLTASYSVLHQDLDIGGYYLYQGNYLYGANWSYFVRDFAAGFAYSTGSSNPDLNFIQQKQYRVGFDVSLLKKLVALNANYFVNYTNGGLVNGANTIYPSYFNTGNAVSSSFLPYINFNRDKRSGLDFTLSLNEKIGEIDYSLGFAGMLFASKVLKRDEVKVPGEEYYYSVGKPLDGAKGYICEGFYTQAEVDAIDGTAAHPNPTFGGEVSAGDLKYKDMNGDGIIDSKDQVYLGKYGWSGSPFNYGINFTMKWKNFTLFALGTGQSGAIRFKNSSYYWVNGSAKYSDEVWGRWTEATQNAATYPRLTATSNSNNFQNSTFWMYKNDRFDLSRVQLTYDFNDAAFKNSFVQGLSVYLMGESLLTLSKERKLMEMNVGSAPQCRYFNIGAKATF